MTTTSPDIVVIKGVPCVSSLAIAEHFQKRHDSVLRKIRDTILECPANFIAHNFVLKDYTDDRGRSLPMYQLSRDGFTLLAMGFAGKKALAWKLRYIEAFNSLEKALAGQAKKKAMPKAIVQIVSDPTIELEPHFQRIRSLVRDIYAEERIIDTIVRQHRDEVLKIHNVHRTLLVNMSIMMDRLFYAMDNTLEAVETHARNMCIINRV